MTRIPKMARIKSAAMLRSRFQQLGFDIPIAETAAPDWSAKTYALHGKTIGNRFAALPMEGWDAGTDGQPTALVERRWLRMGSGGCKLLFGCEAAAISADARANPRQLMISRKTVQPLNELRQRTVAAHRDSFGQIDDLQVGLQLTHSGRWCRPNGGFEPQIAYRHAILDARCGASDEHLLTDADLDRIGQQFVDAAKHAKTAGFDFIDFKHCHGYLCHELLSAVARPGRYGGSFENRTRFLRDVIDGMRSGAPDLPIAVRLSAYDFLPFEAGPDGVGQPVRVPVTAAANSKASASDPNAIAEPLMHHQRELNTRFRFGADPSGMHVDLIEPTQLLSLLQSLGVSLIGVTAGSPYYNPHIQRPAFYPPSDGYQPPNDPLVDVARMIIVCDHLKAAFPALTFVSTGFSYLQEWIMHVAEGVLAEGWIDVIGLGRSSLSYHDLPADALAGRTLAHKRLCRTFSDCTTAPRNGLVSGCYPLDDFYAGRDEAKTLKILKRD